MRADIGRDVPDPANRFIHSLPQILLYLFIDFTFFIGIQPRDQHFNHTQQRSQPIVQLFRKTLPFLLFRADNRCQYPFL